MSKDNVFKVGQSVILNHPDVVAACEKVYIGKIKGYHELPGTYYVELSEDGKRQTFPIPACWMMSYYV